MVYMDRFRERRERLRPTLEATDADGFLVASPVNVRYLTGFTGDASVLLFGRDREIIVSDGRFTTQLGQECPEVEARIRPTGVELSEEIGRVVTGLGWRRLAFEAMSCSVAELQSLSASDVGSGPQPVSRGGSKPCDGSRILSRSKRSERPSDVPSGRSRWCGPGCDPRIARRTSPTRSRRPCVVAVPRRRAFRRSWPSGSERPCRTPDRPHDAVG